jgi:hypothetical protein
MTNGIGRVGWRNYAAPTTTTYPVSLKLFIDAGNTLSYSGSGTTVTDLVGTQNGTLVNGTAYSSANGGTFVFDGINDYINVGNNLLQYDEFSVSMWLKPNGTAGWRCTIQNFSYNRSIGYFGWQLFILPTTNKILIGMNDGTFSDGYRLTSTSSLSISTWYHVCFTKLANGNLKLYINGALDSTKVMTNNTVYNPLCNVRLGLQSDLGYPFPGSIPTAKIFNVALTSTEVLGDFNEFKSRYGYPTYTTRTAAFATATGITDTTILNALNTFDTGLISNGLDTKMKALYPFVGGTANTHKFNFMDTRDADAAFRLQFNGGYIHSSTGAKPNGTNAYADTKFIPLNNFIGNNGHISHYNRTNSSVEGRDISADSVNGYSNIYSYPNDGGNNLSRMTGPQIGYTDTNSLGMYILNRNTPIISYYKNGALKTSSSSTALMPEYSVKISGEPWGVFSPREISLVSIGDGLSDTEVSTLYTLVQAFQTTLSRQV